ncbi:MAG: metallophosphoesterase [Rhodobacter sp.]|nr:metallophosphoesterase [Paracoccaceae bacterium]MCC0077109.1 metallophosphoesterase [Rhodobacter sp.]
MTDNLLFVHLTDLHVNAPDMEDPHLLSDSTATLRRTLAEIKRLTPRPRFIVASGDLTNHGDAASYRALATELAAAGLDLPVIMALGNHDDRQGFHAAFPEKLADARTPYDHAQVIDGLHIVVLDSSVPGEIGGSWEAGQMDWLRARLDEHRDLPTLLVSHHAPMLDLAHTDLEWESLSAKATEELKDAIAGHTVVGILSGHIHMDRVAHWHGVPVVIGMGHHAATDPLDMTDGIRMLDGTGFAYCTLRDSGLTVTFVAHPQTRDVLYHLTEERVRAYLAQREAELAARATEDA